MTLPSADKLNVTSNPPGLEAVASNAPTDDDDHHLPSDLSRVMVVSQRAIRPKLSRTAGFQFEDLIARMTGGALVAPVPGRRTQTIEKVARRVPVGNSSLLRRSLGFEVIDDGRPIDLLFALVQFPEDAILLDAVRNWRSRAGLAACYIEEIWLTQIERNPNHLRPLRELDHIFCASYHSVEALQEATGVPTTFLPYGVDTLMFGPSSLAAVGDRPVDVLNMGRRAPRTHESILEWAKAGDRFYHFDTFAPGPTDDHAAHRWQLGQMLRHSAFFLAHPGKLDRIFEKGHQEELALRWFEAIAAGAVILGQAPTVPVFEEIFHWDDVYIEAPYDSTGVPDLITELEADPTRVERVRLRNIVEALSNHDLAHRWAEICSTLDVSEPARLSQRFDALEHRRSLFTGRLSELEADDDTTVSSVVPIRSRRA